MTDTNRQALIDYQAGIADGSMGFLTRNSAGEAITWNESYNGNDAYGDGYNRGWDLVSDRDLELIDADQGSWWREVNDLEDELHRLEDEFDAAGGRGVELAEAIDKLRARIVRAATRARALDTDPEGE